MALQAGVDIVLEYNAGNDVSPTWVEIGQQVSGSQKITNNLVDTTVKSNAGWDSSAPTTRGWSFSVEGKMDRGDAGIKYLEDKAMNKAQAHLRWRFKTGTTATFTGKCYIEDLDYSMPVKEMATFSCTLKGDAVLTRVEP